MKKISKKVEKNMNNMINLIQKQKIKFNKEQKRKIIENMR